MRKEKISKEMLEAELNLLEEFRQSAWEQERKVKGMLTEYQKEAYDGKTYNKYISNRKYTNTPTENITIKVDDYRVYGTYQLAEGTRLEVASTVYDDSYYSDVDICYPTKTMRGWGDMPQKYKKQYDELVEEMKKHRVHNVTKEYEDKYKVNIY